MTPFAHAGRALVAAATLAGLAALVTGCGSSASPAAPPTATVASTPPESPGSPPAPAPSPSTASVSRRLGPPACATSALRVSVSASQGVAAGSSYYPIVLTNVSGAACTLYGYPGVSFVTGADGSQIGIPATENPAHPRELIILAPGHAGHAELQVVNAENYPPATCGMVTAHWLKVYPPNQTAPLYAGFTAQACTKRAAILTIEAVQPGTSGA